MMRTLLVVALVAGAAGVFAYFTGRTPARGPVEAQPTRGVAALGRLEPAGRVIRLAPVQVTEGLRVDLLLVKEGDRVEKGAILAVMDTLARREAALAEAQARVAVARAKLALVRIGAKPQDILAVEARRGRLKSMAENADRDAKRALRLGGATSRSELDLLQTKRDATRDELRQCEAELASLKTVRDEDITLAQADLQLAEAGVLSARAHRETARLIAPFAGRVLKVNTWAGERVSDKGILELGDTDHMEAVAEVYESDVPRVRLGQPAQVRIPALGKTFTGVVSQVGLLIGKKDVLNNDPVADTDARVVEVRIRLDCSGCPHTPNLTNVRIEALFPAEP